MTQRTIQPAPKKGKLPKKAIKKAVKEVVADRKAA